MGETGPQGSQGSVGLAPLPSRTVKSSDLFLLGRNESITASFPCPDNTRVLSGAATNTGGQSVLRLFGSHPNADGTAWVIEANADSGNQIVGAQFRITVTCAAVN